MTHEIKVCLGTPLEKTFPSACSIVRSGASVNIVVIGTEFDDSCNLCRILSFLVVDTGFPCCSGRYGFPFTPGVEVDESRFEQSSESSESEESELESSVVDSILTELDSIAPHAESEVRAV